MTRRAFGGCCSPSEVDGLLASPKPILTMCASRTSHNDEAFVSAAQSSRPNRFVVSSSAEKSSGASHSSHSRCFGRIVAFGSLAFRRGGKQVTLVRTTAGVYVVSYGQSYRVIRCGFRTAYSRGTTAPRRRATRAKE